MPSKKRPAEKKNPPAQPASAVDLKEISRIVDLMEKKGLSVFHFQKGGLTLKLKRGADLDSIRDALARLPAMAAPAPAAHAAPQASASAASGEMGPTINSPMVGTFYRSSAPGEKAFINVGDTVDENSVVCIVEAMKVMNEIKAEVSGTIVKVLAEDGKPVQYGQPLFELKA